MHSVLSHPLISCDLTVLRDQSTQPAEFRGALYRIGLHLCIAVSSKLKLLPTTITTPLETTTGFVRSGDVVLVPILRAGITLVQPFTDLIPDSSIGYLGYARSESTLEAREYYSNVPTLTADSVVMILDPMLATGGSMCKAIADVKERGARSIQVAAVLAAPEGIRRVEAEHPDVELTCAALDTSLNAQGFIVPGLGDAGDRAHGTL